MTYDISAPLRNTLGRVPVMILLPGPRFPRFSTMVSRKSSLDAGGKPSTLFPPGGLVKLTATPAQVNRGKKSIHAKADADPPGPRNHVLGNILHRESNSTEIIRRPPGPPRNSPGDDFKTRATISGTSENHRFFEISRGQQTQLSKLRVTNSRH